MRYLLLVPVVFLCGCAHSIASYQADCDRRFSSFVDSVDCVRAAIAADRGDSFLPLLDGPMGDKPYAKLYALRAEQLKEQVLKGQISERDARVALLEVYLSLERSRKSSGASVSSVPAEPSGPNLICQDAIARGDRGAMFVHCK